MAHLWVKQGAGVNKWSIFHLVGPIKAYYLTSDSSRPVMTRKKNGKNLIDSSDPSGRFMTLSGTFSVSQAMGDLAVGLQFKFGNLPFGMRVMYSPADYTA